ncbi:unnamed protein product [Didymodactylos carnosus]|uniref:Uncharacterized protein n=1 Tax=Didymodactylos carnosus TaxID=1234261 RepID=A0A8S2RXH4_9BILA|nr:unnamed protein product [Didymodactylos carnosus]CAF4194437.1 unnamed protein product [Didymodactylos carnosus]
MSSSSSTNQTQQQFHATTSAKEVVDAFKPNLEGKVILVTGGSSGLYAVVKKTSKTTFFFTFLTGIGVETARALALTNAHVIITARDLKKGEEVVNDIKKTTSNPNVECMEIHQDSLQSVRKFADQFLKRKLPLNILICNAGIMACPYEKTEDGYESQFAVNHLSHFLLTMLLLPALQAGKPSRVVVVSSVGNRGGGINVDDINWEKEYDKWKAYGQSKTANILFAKQLSKLYADEGIKAYSLHPGGIMTGLQKHLPKEETAKWFDKDGKPIVLMKTVEQGASTTVYAALAPELEGKAGEYLEDCAISRGVTTEKGFWGMAPHSVDMKMAAWLWDLSSKMVEL